MFISIGGSSCTNCATEKFDWELFSDNIWKKWNSKRDLEGKTKPDTKDIISNSVCSTFEMHFWLQILREILNNIIGGRILFKVLNFLELKSWKVWICLQTDISLMISRLNTFWSRFLSERWAGEHRHIQNCSFVVGTHKSLKENHGPISVPSTMAAGCWS